MGNKTGGCFPFSDMHYNCCTSSRRSLDDNNDRPTDHTSTTKKHLGMNADYHLVNINTDTEEEPRILPSNPEEEPMTQPSINRKNVGYVFFSDRLCAVLGISLRSSRYIMFLRPHRNLINEYHYPTST